MFKKITGLLLSGLLCLSLAGCGSVGTRVLSESNSGIAAGGESYGMADSYASTDAMLEYEVSPEDADKGIMPIAETNRKLITTVNLDVETKDYDNFCAFISSQVNESNGYIENSEMYSYDENSRNCNLTIRIPSANLVEFIDLISGQSNVLRKSTNENDVTLNYTDTESHKQALLVERDRLMELLEQAESLDDILSIEDRLTNVRYQLDMYESTLRTYDNQIDYSTVYLNVEEVKVLTEPTPETWLERAGKGIQENIETIGLFFSELVLFVVTHSPVLVLLGLIVVVLVLVIRKAEKKKKLRQEQFQAMMNNSVESQDK